MSTPCVSPRLATVETAAGEVLGESTGEKEGDWRGAGVLHGRRTISNELQGG